jgi:catechol 2,3-dioxygenase-like lactoylglutathione lyase family enzyme
MLDHIKLNVADLAASKAFYEAALAPLGYSVLMEGGDGRWGFGESFPHFWIAQSDSPTVLHVAFRAKTTELVDEFYAAAIAAGGADNGGPGPRSYHPEYYGAFVLDPDGNNVEAVNHGSIVP